MNKEQIKKENRIRENEKKRVLAKVNDILDEAFAEVKDGNEHGKIVIRPYTIFDKINEIKQIVTVHRELRKKQKNLENEVNEFNAVNENMKNSMEML